MMSERKSPAQCLGALVATRVYKLAAITLTVGRGYCKVVSTLIQRQRGIGILVLGLTGAGKSTFISQVTQQQLNIGYSLGSCTTTVHGYRYLHPNGQEVWLIDTPGFDDTNKANAQVLGEIASFLCTHCSNDKLAIGGLLYVHRINDIRMSNASLRSLRVFEALCGESSFGSVTVVTTMWDMLQSQEALQLAERREATLQSRPDFFGRLMQGGAQYARHKDTRISGIEIIEKLVYQDKRITIAVQEELGRDLATALVDTTVGRYLAGDLRDMRKRYESRIAQLQAYNDESGETCDGLVSVVQKEKELMLNFESEIDYLHVTFETLRNERGMKLVEERRIVAEDVPETSSFNDQAINKSTENTTQNNDQYIPPPHALAQPETYGAADQYGLDQGKATVREKRNKSKKASTWEDLLRATMPSHDPRKVMFHERRRSKSEDRAPGAYHSKKALQFRDKGPESKLEDAQYSAHTTMHTTMYRGRQAVEPDRTDQMTPAGSEHQQVLESETWRGHQQMVFGEIRSSSPEAFMAPNVLQVAISWDQSGLRRSYPHNPGTSSIHFVQNRP
ncbi:hypothetical protein SVAN01_07256 [Stagonosporopsis vannaccii]|nr:hypothetical protein SVAN01_07256 [Stagonosporopsis vannaccii]